MHVISLQPLREFWGKHPRARKTLEAWYRVAKKATWTSFADVKADFPSADVYEHLVIFDIGGNKYRLIAAIHYNRGKVYVRPPVLTHADYSRDDWKNG